MIVTIKRTGERSKARWSDGLLRALFDAGLRLQSCECRWLVDVAVAVVVKSQLAGADRVAGMAEIPGLGSERKQLESDGADCEHYMCW